jgi:hypothetical protein
MFAKYILAIALLLSLQAAWADDAWINADGILLRQGDRAWLKVSDDFYQLEFNTTDMRDFARSLHNKRVYVQGRLDLRRGGQFVARIRAQRLTLSEGGGYSRGRWGFAPNYRYYPDTVVVPRRR